MANLMLLIQLLAANKKYQPKDGKKCALLVDWVEDIVYLISMLADQKWKRQLDQNAYWFWFHCIRHLSNILSCYFNFALDPDVKSYAMKDTMPKKGDKSLEDIIESFKQLYRDIKGAMANGDGRPLANSTTPSMWLEACPAKGEIYCKVECANFGIVDHPNPLPNSSNGRKKGQSKQQPSRQKHQSQQQ
jgi:hypothetical protein